MMLDSGVCTIFEKRDTSAPGSMPVYERVKITEGWYGELEFETTPYRPTEYREEVRTDARIRILDDRSIRAGCEAILCLEQDAAMETPVYKITRVFHGRDEESGEDIADLSLMEVGTWT